MNSFCLVYQEREKDENNIYISLVMIIIFCSCSSLASSLSRVLGSFFVVRLIDE